MTAKNTKASNEVRYGSLDSLPFAPPLSKAVKAMSDTKIDADILPDGFWDKAQIIEPDGTEQITLRLPRRVVGHFKATGKGYQTRISSVLASYVDATTKKAG